MEIPKQLRRKGLRFILVQKKDKRPIELKWESENNHDWDAAKLKAHLGSGGNYGVLCGCSGLIVIDADEPEMTKILDEKFPRTFRVKTGSGGTHDYFFCPGLDKKIVLQDDKKHYGEIQSNGSQVVGPGCTHPNGKKYEVVRDMEIATIDLPLVVEQLKPYIKAMNVNWNAAIKPSKSKINELDITSIIDTSGFNNRNGELFGASPWHGSNTGMNLWINKSKNVAFCFRCQAGITVAKAIALNEGIIKSCGDFVNDSDFKKVIKIAQEKYGLEKPKVVNIKGFLKIDNYIENVNNFKKLQPFFYDRAGCFWFWNKEEFKWERVDEVDVMNSIDKGLDFAGQTIQSNIKNGYLEAFKRIGRDNIPIAPKNTWVQFKDKIIDIMTSEEFEASPEYFITNPIPYEVSSNPDTPTMDKIFTEWVGLDNIQLLYEVIAYCLLSDYPLNRIFCFLGPGMNGKSKFLELIKKFIGSSNTTSTELETLIGSRFEIAKLHKKLVCFMGETNFSEISKTSMLKKLSGGDLIGYEIKNKTPFDDLNYAKLLIATNSLPTTNDKTKGFYRRWLVIDYPNSFTEKKDILKDIPDNEYNNLACKSISILKSLLTKREFTNEGDVDERARRYEEKSNPLDKFIKEYTNEDWGGYVFKYDFKRKFHDWCKENRYRKMSDIELNKALRAKYSDVKKQAPWSNDDKERPILWAWEGFSWK